MSRFDMSLMVQYLKNKGYKQEELLAMGDEQIATLYQDIAKDFILQAQDILETSERHENLRKKSMMLMPETINLIGKNLYKLYEEIDNYVDLYSVRDLANLLLSALPGVKLSRVEKMVRIKICALQEIWLLGIRDNLQSLPKEESDALMEYYLTRKDNLAMLRDLYQKSTDPAYLNAMRELAYMKLSIIQEHMPNELESNYKSFYDHSPEKLAIVKDIVAMTAAYSKDTLLAMPMQELQAIVKRATNKRKRGTRQKKQM